MNQRSIKTVMTKLIKLLGNKEKAAQELGISVRMVYYYLSGRKAPIHMYYAIMYLLDQEYALCE